MNSGTLDSRLFKHAGNFIGAVLGAAKDQHLFHFRVSQQQFLKERAFATLVDAVKFLVNAFNGRALRCHLNPHRVRAQNRRGKLCNIVRHGRAEEQVLPILRQQCYHLTDIVNEAHIQHAIRFVQHEEFKRLQGHRFLVNQIEQAAGSCHQHIYTANQVTLLAYIAHATENAGGRDSRKLGVLLKTVFYLNGKLTSREENQRAASLGRTELSGIQQQLQNRESKGRRLARTRLGDTQQVTPLQQTRD